MRHGIKKIKFNGGKDATKMIVRNLLTNFINTGKIVTTEKKAKVLKTSVEKIIEKSKKKTEANKNYLLRKIADVELVKILFDQIGPFLIEKNGGYVKLTKLQQRISDGAKMTEIKWSHPLVREIKKTEKSEIKK